MSRGPPNIEAFVFSRWSVSKSVPGNPKTHPIKHNTTNHFGSIVLCMQHQWILDRGQHGEVRKQDQACAKRYITCHQCQHHVSAAAPIRRRAWYDHRGWDCAAVQIRHRVLQERGVRRNEAGLKPVALEPGGALSFSPILRMHRNLSSRLFLQTLTCGPAYAVLNVLSEKHCLQCVQPARLKPCSPRKR